MHLNADELRKLLDYDPVTGVFTWRSGGKGTAGLGSPAGGRTGYGYTVICIRGRNFPAHRLAWLHVHGEWPPDQVDHVNGERSDNRIENLRLATSKQNSANRKCTGRDRVKGVRFESGKWRARIEVNGRKKHLGSFEQVEAAAAAYKAAAVKYFGEFART